jgi:hypothetical protein
MFDGVRATGAGTGRLAQRCRVCSSSHSGQTNRIGILDCVDVSVRRCTCIEDMSELLRLFFHSPGNTGSLPVSSRHMVALRYDMAAQRIGLALFDFLPAAPTVAAAPSIAGTATPQPRGGRAPAAMLRWLIPQGDVEGNFAAAAEGSLAAER